MHSKVRSGCGTCKRRKLKCDEGKPECERCVKSGIECLGYGPPKVKTQQTIHPSPRSLVTLRPKNVQRRIVQTDRVLPTPQLTRSLSPIHLNSSDVGYFDMFRHYILHDIKVWCRGLGFDKYLIQEFMREESVRAAILGLTAMSKATQLSYENLTGLLKAETRRHKPTRYTLKSSLTDDEERTARLEDIFYHLYVKCPQYIWTHSREDLRDRIQPNEIPTLPTNDLPVDLLCINWERTMRLVKRFSMSLCPETPISEYEEPRISALAWN
ncbi:hypothetical protein Trisim1_005182 [Trichoderma cf. simile WF8]